MLQRSLVWASTTASDWSTSTIATGPSARLETGVNVCTVSSRTRVEPDPFAIPVIRDRISRGALPTSDSSNEKRIRPREDHTVTPAMDPFDGTDLQILVATLS